MELSPTEVPPRRLSQIEYDRSLLELARVDGEMLGELEWTEHDDHFFGLSPLLPPSEGHYSRLSVFADVSDADASLLLANALEVGEIWAAAVNQRHPGDMEERLLELASQAWRVPVTDGRIAALGNWFRARTLVNSAEAAARDAVSSIFIAPEFLYVLGGSPGETDGSLTSGAIVTELSLGILGKTPDASLVDRAGVGLERRDQVHALVSELLASSDGGRSFGDFGVEYLQLSEAEPRRPPGLPELFYWTYSSLIEQTHEYFSYALSDGWTLRNLLTSPYFPVSDELSSYYGVPSPAPSSDWQMMEVENRAGMLTLGAFLAEYSDEYRASPVRRGAVILERLLCTPLEVPAAAASLEELDESLTRQMTNRQRLDAHLTDPSCAGCHQVIDPIGHAFGHFAGSGQYSELEAWWPPGEDPEDVSLTWLEVDTTGTFPDYLPAPMAGAEVDGAETLAALLSETPAVHECFAGHLVEWFLGRELVLEHPHDSELLSVVAEASLRDDAQLVELVRLVLTSDAFLARFDLEAP